MKTQGAGHIRRKLPAASAVAACLMLVLFSSITLAAGAGMAVTMTESSRGFVRIKDENALFYRFSAAFTAGAEASLVFKEHSGVLIDQAGRSYPQFWLNITSATAGVSFIQEAPINMRALAIESPDGLGQSGRWNLSQIDGPDGTLEFKIPKGGQIVLDFLWLVPQDFQPGRLTLGSWPEVILSQP